VEEAGEEDENYEKKDWRGVAQFDLDGSACMMIIC
jgi:hypothetical protein